MEYDTATTNAPNAAARPRGAFHSLLRSEYVLLAVVTLAAAVLWVMTVNPAYFMSPDAYDYAQMAVQLNNGEGFTTKQLFPRHIPYLAERGFLVGAWPNLNRYPMPVIMHAVGQRIMGDPLAAGALATGVMFIASVPLLFTLARAVAGPWTAVWTVALYVAVAGIRQGASNGMTEVPATAITLAIALLAIVPEKVNRLHWFAMGLLLGVGFLTRTQLAYMAPALTVLVFLDRRRAYSRVLLLALGGALAVLPWAARNQALVGDPLFSFNSSRNIVIGSFPERSDIDMQLNAPVDSDEVQAQYGDAIRQKMVRNLFVLPVSLRFWRLNLEGLPALPLLLMPIGFFLALRSRNPVGRRFAILLAGMVFFNYLLLASHIHLARYYLMLAPFFVLAGMLVVEKAAALAGSHRQKLLMVITALVLVIAGIRYDRIMRPQGPLVLTRADIEAMAQLAELTEPDAVIASVWSWQIPLLANRRAVRMPADPAELFEIDDRYLRIDYVTAIPPVPVVVPDNGRNEVQETYEDVESFYDSEAFLARYEPLTVLANGDRVWRRRTMPTGATDSSAP